MTVAIQQLDKTKFSTQEPFFKSPVTKCFLGFPAALICFPEWFTQNTVFAAYHFGTEKNILGGHLSKEYEICISMFFKRQKRYVNVRSEILRYLNWFIVQLFYLSGIWTKWPFLPINRTESKNTFDNLVFCYRTRK